ncbi:ECF transporter S component [Sanguibacter sp. A247]|uniref:ECF transporter S component n=1 Tax=unclassified Sanguibacter TaxID=2645534 RepID=UPI003FD856C1
MSTLTSRILVVLTSLLGAAMLGWPLLASVTPRSEGQSAPWLVVVLVPLVLASALAAVTRERPDPRALALVGVLGALIAALRLLGTGLGGFEPMFVLLVLAAAVLGPSLGFSLGALAMLVSALLTAGVGPWLPFQAFAAAWVGAGAGAVGRLVLPGGGRGPVPGAVPDEGRRARVPRRAVIALAAYGIVAAYLYGLVTNLWFWPFALGDGTQLSYVPGGGLGENLPRFVWYTLATSTLTVDTVRAVVTAVGVLVLGSTVLGVLGRAQKRLGA